MKRIILTLTFVAIAMNVVAQDLDDYAGKDNMDGRISIGVQGGANFSRFLGDNAPHYKEMYTGYHAGVVFDVHIDKTDLISFDIDYSLQGAKSDSVGISSKRLDLVNIRMGYRHYFGDTHLFLSAYPVDLTVPVGMKTKTGNGAWQKFDDANLNVMQWYVGAGAGYTFKDRATIYARLFYDVSNIYNKKKWGEKNHPFTIETGICVYLFRL